MNHRQDRYWNPNQETNYPLGFKTSEICNTYDTEPFSHIVSFGRTGLSSEIVGLGKTSLEKDMEIQIRGTHIFIYV